MREKQIIKLFRAVELIARSSGATNGELSKHLGVDRKSVYRTLKTLEAIEFPLYEERSGREVCWKFEAGYLRKLPNISLPELNLSFIEHVKDGSVIPHLKTSGRYDVKRWVMGIGPGAVVLEPEDLRQEVMEDLRRALERHEQGRPISSESDQH